jgi:DNA-binding NarL/FixJ family response regulator
VSATISAGPVTVRVVVAEGHPLLRLGALRALRGDPRIAVVGDAEDGLEALELARRVQPDVLVVELRMPVLGGAVMLGRLRREMPAVKALVLSASEARESVLDALAAGAAGYLSKRTTGEQLREAVVATHRGDAVISPELVGHLVSQFSIAEAPTARLTAAELEMVRLVAAGLTDREIAEQLYVSRHTVQNRLTRIREKTGMRRRSELARWAVEHALA